MAPKEPFTDVDVPTRDGGFYEGYSLPIALISKSIMVALVLWALIWPLGAGGVLSSVNGALLQQFNTFYVLSVGLFAIFLFAVALIPATGRRVLGGPEDTPEFTNFSWFAMMFGAGLGVGLMTFATAEPVGLWGSNPMTVTGEVQGNTPEALQSTYRYTLAHFGFHAWGIYVMVGLSLAYYAFRRGLPLTIRSALTPLFGRFVNGFFGHVLDVLGVVATILGVSVTIGFGVAQFVDGVYSVTGMEWLQTVTEEGAPAPSTVGQITGLVIIMLLSIVSAVSGVGRGIKWLSNINLVLSFLLLLTFIVFGSFLFAMTTYATALIDYLLNFLQLSFAAFSPQSLPDFTAALPSEASGLDEATLAALYAEASANPWGSFASFRDGLPPAAAALDEATLTAIYAAGVDGRLFAWQAGWTTFYWAWWIAFAPFVGLFLARISKGRTVREFVLGAVIAPSMVCWAWMTILGASAIDLELQGVADGAVIAASNSQKLFVSLEAMVPDWLYPLLVIMCVVLILTFLITSADSGILVMNTIMSGGAEETGIFHRIIWGVIMTLVIGTLLVAGGGGLSALQNAMIIGALPFTVVMVLMMLSLAKALWNDGRRERAGMDTALATPAE
ncbi:MAG: BCCT family transporter [Pseudomonadota bacterium]